MYKPRGFTVVELMIVIVVIGILAGISIATYNGVQQKSRDARAQANLKQYAKKIELFAVQKGRMPTSLAEVNIANESGIVYGYTAIPKDYCVTATSNDIVYSVTSSTDKVVPGEGACDMMLDSQYGSVSTAMVASAENLPNEGAAKAFDGNTNTKWLAFQNTMSVIFSTTSRVSPVSYDISSGNDAPGRRPRSWVLEGSHDRISWTTIDSRSGQSFSGEQATNSYSVSSPESYKHFQFRITQNNGDSLTQVSRIILKGASGPVSVITN